MSAQAISTLHRALRRIAGLVFLLVLWVLAGACQRHGVGGFLLCNNTTTTTAQATSSEVTSKKRESLASTALCTDFETKKF